MNHDYASASTSIFHADIFRLSCRLGLSSVRPLNASAEQSDSAGWNYGSALVPSYQAFGRLRFLLTLREASKLSPRRVLDVAAGDASLSACLADTGASV